MLRLFFSFFLVFCQSDIWAQFDFRAGENDPGDIVPYDRSKIKNPFKRVLSLHVKYEDGAWESKELAQGMAIFDLSICGKPNGQNCIVRVRIYTAQSESDEVLLEGGTRFRIYYDSKRKKYYFKKEE